MKNVESHEKKLGIILAITGLAAAAILIFWNIGQGSIDLRDEALTAGRSLYIYHTGSIINTEVNGELSVRKPPLVYLLTALSYKLFGINELGLRLPNALFGFGIFVVTLWGAWNLAGPLFGGLSPWLLIGCFNIIRVSREALTDTAFIFGLALAVISIAIHLSRINSSYSSIKSRNIHCPLLFSIGIVIASMSKGPLAFYLPCATIIFLFLMEKRLVPYYLVASVAASLPFLFWFAAQAAASSQFLSIYIGQEYFERANYESDFLTQFIRPPEYYLTNLWRWFRLSGVIASLSSFWIVICLARHYLKKEKRRYCNRNIISKENLFLVFSWITYFCLASWASHKSRRYILPVFPIMTILSVVGFKGMWELCVDTKCKKALSIIITVTVFIGLFALKSHYLTTPDYLPERKEIALRLKKLVDQGYKIYSNDERLAPILHFYLDKTIPVINDPSDIPEKKWVFVFSKQPHEDQKLVENYEVIVHD